MHVRERSQHVLSLGDDGGRTWSQEKHASAIRAGPRRLKPSSLARRKLQWDERLHAGLNACAQSLGGKGQAACCFPADGDDAQQVVRVPPAHEASSRERSAEAHMASWTDEMWPERVGTVDGTSRTSYPGLAEVSRAATAGHDPRAVEGSPATLPSAT